MKNLLTPIFVGATILSASAEVTTFVPQGAPMCRYQAPANAELVEMPAGFCWRIQSETKQRGPQFVEKAISSSLVELNEAWLKENPDDINSTAITLVPCSHIMCGSLRWPWDRAFSITPAAGVTVTSIKMKLNDPKYYFPVSIVETNGTTLNRLEDFSYNANDSTLTWTGSRDKAFFINNMGQNYERKTGISRGIYIEVTNTGTPTHVAIPECNIKRSVIAENEKVELTCATPGAQIYYTVDYERTWNAQTKYVPSTDATLYTGPFAIEKDAIVRAYAVKDGMTPSFKTYHELYLMPEYQFMADFNFNDYTSLKDEEGKQIVDFQTYPVVNTAVSTSTVEKVSLASTPAVSKDVTFTGTVTNEKDGTGCDLTLSNTFGGVVQLRPLSGAKMFVSVPDDKYITAVYMEASVSNSITFAENVDGSSFKKGEVNACYHVWTANGSKDVCEVVLDITAGSQYVDHLYVYYSNVDGSGVNGIEIDNDENAPAEYFNLQGIRVANPAQGNIYIKRQGSKVSKILF